MRGKLHISSKIAGLVLTLTLILMAVVPLYAWYAMTNRLSLTEKMEVDMPPTIYIKDDNLQEITSFNLDGLTIGEEYNEVFCVSPAIVGSVNSFFLGVIYSENLGMNINLYPVYSVADTEPSADTLYESRVINSTPYYFQFRKEKQDGSDNIADTYTYKETYGNWNDDQRPAVDSPYYGNLNYGVFKSYDNNLFSAVQPPNTPDLIDELNDTSRSRFFILNVTWRDDIDYQGEANVKEADIVYIVAKGTMKLTQ
ncbi:MAG: hypothetical protein PUC29_04435 [Clostridia bacterium]|nr:hypothetical protein [Clostridia bacterium]